MACKIYVQPTLISSKGLIFLRVDINDSDIFEANLEVNYNVEEIVLASLIKTKFNDTNLSQYDFLVKFVKIVTEMYCGRIHEQKITFVRKGAYIQKFYGGGPNFLQEKFLEQKIYTTHPPPPFWCFYSNLSP